jgi:hypothetical protein
MAFEFRSFNYKHKAYLDDLSKNAKNIKNVFGNTPFHYKYLLYFPNFTSAIFFVC